MDLNDAILKKRIIDIEMPGNKTHTGVCLKANKNIWILVNYDYSLQKFNGLSIFKNELIETFSVWKKGKLKILEDNIGNYELAFNLKKINTFYTCLMKASTLGVIAFFIGQDYKNYYVGKIASINRTTVNIRLVNKDGKFSKYKTIKLVSISYFSFCTDYEIALQKATR